MTIFLGLSGETNERDRLLSLLMEWTTEGRILAAMMKAGRADAEGIQLLGAMVVSTRDGPQAPALLGEDGKPLEEQEERAPVLDERKLAAAVCSFLVDDDVRDVVAEYVHESRSLFILKAKEELFQLRRHLQTTWYLQPEQIPRFVAGDPERLEMLVEAANAEIFFRNEIMRLPAEDLLAAWTAPVEMTAEDAEYLRALRPEVAEIALRFPPWCLVKAVGQLALMCPPLGYLAIVCGYEIIDGHVALQVKAYLDDDAPQTAVLPEWVERVACRGLITPEAVEGVRHAVEVQ